MKNIKLKTLLLTLPLVLVGCGGNGGGESSTSANSSSQTESSQNSSESSQEQGSSSQQGGDSSQQGSSQSGTTAVTVKFWHTFGQTIEDALKAKKQTFHDLVLANDGVDVTIDLKYGGSYDDIAKKISDGYSVMNTPTMAVAYPDNVADYLEIGKSANSEFVVNLESFVNDSQIGFGKEKWLGDKYGADDFVEEFYSEGQQYSVPGTYSLPFLKSTEIMFYNMDALKDVMATYKPEFNNSEVKIKEYMSRLTWDDFITLCRYIKNNTMNNPDYNMLEVPMFYDSDANLFITKMYQNKIPYSSISNGKGKIDFQETTNFNKTVDMLDEFRQLYADGLMMTKGIKGTYGSDYFTGEKCVFSIGSSGGSGYNFPQAEAFELGVCRVPVSNNTPLYVSQGPTLAMFNDRGLSTEANALAQKYAWKFMKYITNAQASAEICVNGSEGYIPVRNSAYETSFFQDFMEEGERYAQCYKVVVDDINSDAGYLVSPAFKGSASLRNECGSLLTASLNAANKEAIPTLVNRAINNALLKM